MANNWIEPPPQQNRMGCFAKGCLILFVCVVLLGAALAGVCYWAVRHFRESYLPSAPMPLPTVAPMPEEQTAEAPARWDAFETAGEARQPARIGLSAAEINALVLAESDLKGQVFVSIENNIGRVRMSIPLDEVYWLEGRYLNAEFTVQAAPDQRLAGAKISNIVVNGRLVSDDVIDWQYGSRSIRTVVAKWTQEKGLTTFDIKDNQVFLGTTGGD